MIRKIVISALTLLAVVCCVFMVAGSGGDSCFRRLWITGSSVIVLLLLAAHQILVLIKTIGRRHKPGNYSNCGYSVTGLPEPRCPDCGTEFER